MTAYPSGTVLCRIYFLAYRMKELELSHKALLAMIDQLNVKLHQVENANVRVKGKLRHIQEDLINLVRRVLFQIT